MSDHKVNLPKTDFPMKANLAEREPQMLQFWREINLHEKIKAISSQRQPFVLHDGPPYANGEIHLGHALNKILKDIVNKCKFMDGYGINYVPGWDCHGLPIELNIEKKLGKVGQKIGTSEFIAACRNYANQQIDAQRRDFIRLGIIGDWEHPYCTMNFKYEANIVRALAKIIDNGYVVRGYKPVHWCIACGSALAEAEVEYQDKTSPAIDVRFRLLKPELLVPDAPTISIPIWTTTPWTLPANEAVALNPQLEYSLVYLPHTNEHLLIAHELLTSALKRYQIEEYNIVKTIVGTKLEGLLLQHPFLPNKQVPIILGEHVTTEAGTGAVHTAPTHGQDDYLVGKKYNLPVNNPVSNNGRFLPNVPFFANQEVFAANEQVIKLLQENNNLLHAETMQHSYPHCWRHKTPLIFRTTPQWFIDLEVNGKYGSLRKLAQTQIENITWLPERGKERIKAMIEQRPDWCISRQRVWLTPMTLFVDKNTGELHPATQKLMELIAQEIEKQGILFWQHFDTQQFLQTHAPEYSPANYEKITDTLDVWFDSGVSHFCVLKHFENLNWPADLYLEGSDQYRGWFQSSLLTALALYGKAPYLNNVSHGFTVDAKGHKMSKSLGNVISPQKINNSLGADVLRLWAASTYMFDELAISDEILKSNTDAYRMLRNTMRFLLSNLYDFNPQTDLLPFEKMLDLDIYAIQETLKLETDFYLQCNKFNFHLAARNLQKFASVDLSSFYFSIIKDRLYTMKTSSKGRRSAQTALFYLLEILVRCLAPFLSFTAEEIWQTMRKQFASPAKDIRTESIFLTNRFNATNNQELEKIAASANKNSWYKNWQELQTLRAAVNKELETYRINGKIGSSLEAEVILYCDEEKYELLSRLKTKHENESELRFILITSSAEVLKTAAKPVDAVAAELEGLWVKIIPSPHPKCPRCWHHRPDIGKNPTHPDVCVRCASNLDENSAGEERKSA